MARGYRDIPRGDPKLSAQRPRGGGGARGAAISPSGGARQFNPGSPGQASIARPRVFGIEDRGSWGLRALANAFQHAGDVAERAADTAFRERAKTVEREQTKAGAEYGLANEDLADLHLPDGNSIGDEAFRRSAIMATSSKAEMAARADVERLGEQYAGKPEAFRSALSAASQKFLGGLDENLRVAAADTYGRLGEAKYRELDQDWKAYQKDQNRAAIIKSADELSIEAAQHARRGDYDGALEAVSRLRIKMQAAGPVEAGGAGALSLVEVEQQSQAAKEVIQKNYLEGWVDRNQKNPRRALAGLNSGKTGDPALDGILQGMDPGKVDPIRRSLETDIKVQEAEARAAAREARAEALQRQQYRIQNLDDQVDAVVEAVRSGLPVAGAPELAKLIGQEAAGAGNQDVLRATDVLQSKLSSALETAGFAREFALLPAGDQQTVMQALRTTPHAPEDAAAAAAHIQVAAKIYTANQEALAQGEGLERANALGAIDLAPVDPGDPDSIAKRGQDVAAAARLFGVPPERMPILTKGEALGIVEAFDSANTADERLGLLQNFGTALKDDATARRAFAQLEEKKLPADARFAMELLRKGDVPAARRVMAGLGVDAKDMPKLGDAKASEVEDALDALMGDPDSPASMSTHLANVSQQPGLYRRSEAERAAMLRMALQNAAAGDDAATAAQKAAATLHGDQVVAGDDSLGRITVPSSADAAAVTAGMAAIRRGVDLSMLSPFTPPARPGQEGTGAQEGERLAAERDHQRMVEAIRAGGLWTPVDGGYALLSPSGVAIPDPANPRKPKVWTLGELTAAGQGQPPPGYDMFMEVPPDLHGDAGLDRLNVDYQGATPQQTAMELARRWLRNAGAARSADVPVTAEQAAALGIPARKE